MSADNERPSDAPEAREPKLLERARARMRAKHLSLRTEKAYLGWMRQYILFHGRRHPAEMGEIEINAFLARAIPVRESGAGIICTRERFSGPSGTRCAGWVCPSRRPFIAFVIRSQPIS